MSFSKPFSPHQIFFHAMIDILAIFLHENNDFIEENEEFKLGEDFEKFKKISKILKFQILKTPIFQIFTTLLHRRSLESLRSYLLEM